MVIRKIMKENSTILVIGIIYENHGNDTIFECIYILGDYFNSRGIFQIGKLLFFFVIGIQQIFATLT